MWPRFVSVCSIVLALVTSRVEPENVLLGLVKYIYSLNTDRILAGVILSIHMILCLPLEAESELKVCNSPPAWGIELSRTFKSNLLDCFK